MKTSASMRLSVALQAIAGQLEDALNDAAGERIAFVLVLQADGACWSAGKPAAPTSLLTTTRT